MDVDGAACRQSGTDAVGAGDRLAPGGPDLQPDVVRALDGPPISADVENDPLRIGHDRHRTGLTDDVGDPLEGGPGRRQEIFVLAA